MSSLAWTALKKMSSPWANKNVSLTPAPRGVSRLTAPLIKNKTKQQVYSDPQGALESNGKAVLYNFTFDKGRLKSLVLWSLKKYGEAKTIVLLENLKKTGFEYATKAGISLGVEDLKIPPKKAVLLYEAEIITKEAVDQFERSEITGVERYQRLIETWHRTSEELKQEVIDNFEKTDVLNPVYMMAFSGARGNISQVRQLVGMRGLMSDPKGQLIDYPIRSNFREGLTITEYIISSYGARKGIVDTALRTATAGYLTRRLVDVAQHVVISAYDCGTNNGVFLTDIKEGIKTIFTLQTRLLGRVLARNLYKKTTGSSRPHSPVDSDKAGPVSDQQDNMPIKLASRNEEVSAKLAAEIPKHYKKVFVRSPLTCHKKQFICQLCYGWSLAQGNLVSIGEAVGIVAAQSIGEPGTQLTMRTFHTGGAFAGEISDQIRAPFNGIVHYPDKIAGMLCRNPDGKMVFLTKIDGIILVSPSKDSSGGQQPKQFKIPAYTLLYNQPGESVHHKQVIAQISAIARQAGMQEDASLVLKSQMQGQFMIHKLTLQSLLIGPSQKEFSKKASTNTDKSYFSNTNNNAEQLNPDFINPNTLQVPGYNPITQDKLFAAWNWGYAWILSCQKYHMPVFSNSYGIAGRGATLIPFSGDFVDNNSSLVQVDWYLPQHGGFYTSLGSPNTLGTLRETTNTNQLLLSTGLDKRDQTLSAKVDEKALLLKPINYAAQAWPEKQQSVTLNDVAQHNSGGVSYGSEVLKNNSGSVKIQKTLLALDIRNVVYKKFGYFVDTNKGLTLEGKTYSTVLFLPTNLKGGSAPNNRMITNSLFNFTLDNYVALHQQGQKTAPTQPRQKLKRGQKVGNPKVFGVQAFINTPQNLSKVGASNRLIPISWGPQGKSGGSLTNLSQNLLSNLPKSYSKTKIAAVGDKTIVTNGSNINKLNAAKPQTSLRVTNITWPLDKGPMLSNDVQNKTLSYRSPASGGAKTQNLVGLGATQYSRFFNYKKTGAGMAHQIKKYYKKNYAQLKFSKLLEPVRDFFKEFHAASLLPTLKSTPKYTTNHNLKVWYSKKYIQDSLSHRATNTIKNPISKAMSNNKIRAGAPTPSGWRSAIQKLTNQSLLGGPNKVNNTKGVTDKHGSKKKKSGAVYDLRADKVTLIQNKYAPLVPKRKKAYSSAEQLIENQRITRFYPISNRDADANLFAELVKNTHPESVLIKQQLALTTSSSRPKRKYSDIKASFIFGPWNAASMSKLYIPHSGFRKSMRSNQHRGLEVFNYLVSGLTQDTLDTMCWYSNKKAESCLNRQPLQKLKYIFKDNDSRLGVSASRLEQLQQSILPTSNKWVYKTFGPQSITHASLAPCLGDAVFQARKKVFKVVLRKGSGKVPKNSCTPAKPGLADKDCSIKKFLNYNFGQDVGLSTGLNATQSDVVWYINKKPRFLPKEFLTVGGFAATNDTVKKSSRESGSTIVTSPIVYAPKSKKASVILGGKRTVSKVDLQTNIFELTKPIYLHICNSSSNSPQGDLEQSFLLKDNYINSFVKSQKSNNTLRSKINRATIIRNSFFGKGQVNIFNVKNSSGYNVAESFKKGKMAPLDNVQPTLKHYSLDTHINNSSNWSSSFIPVFDVANNKDILVNIGSYTPTTTDSVGANKNWLAKKVSVYNNSPFSFTKTNFCLAGKLVIKAAVPDSFVGPLYSVLNKPQELTKSGAAKCLKAIFSLCGATPQVFYKKVDLGTTLAPKEPNSNKRQFTRTSRISILNKQKCTLNPLSKTPNANLFVYSLTASGVSTKTNPLGGGLVQTNLLSPEHGSNLTSLLLTYHAPNMSFSTYKMEDLVKQELRLTAPTTKLGQVLQKKQKLNTQLRKAGLEELLGSNVTKKPFYMRQAYEVTKYTALGSATFNEMYINIAPPTSSLKALSKATMLEGGTNKNATEKQYSFYLENYIKKASFSALLGRGRDQDNRQGATEPLKLLQNHAIGAHMTLNTSVAPLMHSICNQAGLELASLFKYKNFMPLLNQSFAQQFTNGSQSESSKESHTQSTPSSSTGYKVSYWPLTGVESPQSGGMSKTKYHVAPPAHLGGSERPQFSNISHSLMALASTSFLSNHTGEVVYGLGYSKSPKKAFFGQDNPLAYLTKQKINNNQARCLLLTSKDLKGFNIELYKSDQLLCPEKQQDSQLSHLSMLVAPHLTENLSGVAALALQSKWASSVKRTKKVMLSLVYSVETNQSNDQSALISTKGRGANKLPICGQLALKGQLVTLPDIQNVAPASHQITAKPPTESKQSLTRSYTTPGQIIGVHWSIRTPNQMNLTIRKGQPIFISARTTFHSFHGDFVKNNESVVTLIYQKIKTGDIIQGIPKVEQFFEARTTKRGRLFRDNLPNLLKGLFLKYYYQNLNSLKGPLLRGAPEPNFSKPVGTYLKKHRVNLERRSLDLKYLAVDWAVKQSFYKIRQIAVDGVLRVYRSQGVSISDKHLEVIVKQMTTKVRVIDRGHSALFPGELVDYDFVQKLNGYDPAYNDSSGRSARAFLIKKVLYEPIVLGITKASLHVDSFLSAASFQQTARILRESALVKKRDFLKGVKENVMVGNLIPTGTGYIVS